ncbi:MAG: hypothetical protein J3Q66DRAFT_285802 [Benniella sp.]|nr:MAG: hypothetical protein J3Q66DRAFT_285802 [Benniella sp.]
MKVEHLRQVRTKFDRINTYDLSRCSGPITNSILYQPLETTDAQGGVFAAGPIFNKICQSVILHAKKARLYQDVKNALEMCQSSKSQEFESLLKNILELFGPNKKMKIIGNSPLNEQLEPMVDAVTKRIGKNSKQETCTRN